MSPRAPARRRAAAPLGAVASACALAAAHLALAAAAHAEVAPPEPCLAMVSAAQEAAAEPGLSARLAQDCRMAAEREFGPDAPELLQIYHRIAAALTRDADSAVLAIPHRERALGLSARLNGESVETAEAAMALSRSLILSGRCTPDDAQVIPLIDRAAAIYGRLSPTDPARWPGLSDVARAYADGLRYGRAAATLASVETGAALDTDALDRRRLSVDDWMRIGSWRMRADNAAGAALAFAMAGERAEDPYARARARRRLRAALFAAGDFDALRALDAGPR